MEEEFSGSGSRASISPEIVEIAEEGKSISRDVRDVYVAVGKDDLDVLKWALENAVLPGGRVFLIHVFPPIHHIPTPVGKLSKSQVSVEQWKAFVNQESNRRRNILHKYIRLCAESKVTAETLLIESNLTAKAIVDLIPVLNITLLVIGSRKSSLERTLRRGSGKKGEFVRRNAPEFCQVLTVREGRGLTEASTAAGDDPLPPAKARRSWKIGVECWCYGGQRHGETQV